MQGIDEKLALEAIKPAAGLVGALLSPKVENLRRWAEKRELKGKLDADVLATVMERYLLKLAERVSEITSIAFPQNKLNIFDAYEPLALRRFGYHFDKEEKKYNIDNLIKSARGAFVVIDDAGMGKSTFSKFVVACLLTRSNRIPIFFELRKIKENMG